MSSLKPGPCDSKWVSGAGRLGNIFRSNAKRSVSLIALTKKRGSGGKTHSLYLRELISKWVYLTNCITVIWRGSTLNFKFKCTAKLDSLFCNIGLKSNLMNLLISCNLIWCSLVLICVHLLTTFPGAPGSPWRPLKKKEKKEKCVNPLSAPTGQSKINEYKQTSTDLRSFISLQSCGSGAALL